jgi:hypothetical protein
MFLDFATPIASRFAQWDTLFVKITIASTFPILEISCGLVPLNTFREMPTRSASMT